MRLRTLLRSFVVSLLVALMAFVVFAHPGRTDAHGGHKNHSTGEYHYHHGYPEHQHTNGVCPYDFDDQTGKSSGTSSGRSTSAKENGKDSSSNSKPVTTEPADEVKSVPPWVYCVFALLLCVIVCLIVDIRNKKSNIDELGEKIKDKEELQDELYAKDLLMKGKEHLIQTLQKDIDRQNSRIAALQSYISDLIAILEQTRNAPPRDDVKDMLGEDFSASNLKLPDDVYFIEGFVPVIGRTSVDMPYGDLTVYTSPTGKCYHSNPRCGSGFLRPAHAYDVIWNKTPCIHCAKEFPAHPPDWYRRIKHIANSRKAK